MENNFEQIGQAEQPKARLVNTDPYVFHDGGPYTSPLDQYVGFATDPGIHSVELPGMAAYTQQPHLTGMQEIIFGD